MRRWPILMLTLTLTLLLVALAPVALGQGPRPERPAQETETATATSVVTTTLTVTATATLTPTVTETPTVTTTVTTTPTVVLTSTPTTTPTMHVDGCPPFCTPTPTATATPTASATPEYRLFAPWLAKVAPGYPGAPSLEVSNVSGLTLTLNWTSVPGAAVYTVWYSRSPDLSDAVQVYNGSDTTTTLTLPPGTLYLFGYAVNAWGASRSAINVVALAPPTPTPVPGIVGRITDGGAPAGGVTLWLRDYDGTDPTTLATAVTDADGAYLFPNVASLAPGHLLFVYYPNVEQNTQRLGGWLSDRLSEYTAGTRVAGGDFDIKGISLRSPAPALPLPCRPPLPGRGAVSPLTAIAGNC